MKNMIESVSTQLPPSKLAANEILQRVQEMLTPIINQPAIHRDYRKDELLTAFVQLKRDVFGSSDD